VTRAITLEAAATTTWARLLDRASTLAIDVSLRFGVDLPDDFLHFL